MDSLNKDRKTCLDCAAGCIAEDGAVRCSQHDKEVVQWFTTPKSCLNFKEPA